MMINKLVKFILSVSFIVFCPKYTYANCPEEIISLEKAKPFMETYFQELKSKNNILDKIDNESIYLKKEFSYLSKLQKKEILALLKLGFGEFSSLSNEMLDGHISPYNVYDYLGRIVSFPYDGCGNFITFTEHARKNLEAVARGEYKRVERYKIDKRTEEKIRKVFHKLFVYNSAIYWISEANEFEIDLSEINKNKINKFLKTFPKYKFFIMTMDGEFVFEK